MDEILKLAPLEERIYRHRCVETLVHRRTLDRLFAERDPEAVRAGAEPNTSRSRAITDRAKCLTPSTPGSTIHTSKACGWTKRLHPLTLLCVGMYGETLPNQDGAPVRIVVPWKYGYKSIKSIVKIKFQEKNRRPLGTNAAPNEYDSIPT